MGTVAGDCIRYGGAFLTEALFYDLSDRAHPRLTGTLGQSGSYLSSRMVGNYPVSYTHLDVYKRQAPGYMGEREFEVLP